MTLARLPLIVRFFLLLAAFALPACGAGAVVAGWKGAVAGLVLADLLVLVLGFRSEALLSRAFGAVPAGDPGLRASFDAVIRAIEIEWGGFDRVDPPRLFVFPDPVPNCATVRGIGGAGTVLVSQGLLSALTEPELRAALRGAVLRVDEPEWIFSSLCAALASLLLRAAPRAWVSLFYSAPAGGIPRDSALSPFSLLRFATVFPWIRLSLALSARVPARATDAESWFSAMQKIRREIRPGIRVRVPAAIRLYLVDPTPPHQLA